MRRAFAYTVLGRGPQTGGISPFPETFRANGLPAPFFNIYDDGLHMIGYPVNDHELLWG